MGTKITDLTELTASAASDDVLHIVDVNDTSGGSAGTSKKIKVSNLTSAGSGTVTSVALAVPSALSVAGSPVTTAGTITISGAGTSSQYIDGTGGLQTTPTGTVTGVTGVAPVTSTGGVTPAIGITAATTSAAGSMSSADKTKLDGIATGAEVNVNADWNSSSGDSEILNKPNLNELDGEILEVITRSSAYNANGQHEGDVIKFGSDTIQEGKFYVLATGWTAVDADTESKTKGLFGVALGGNSTTNGLLVKGVHFHATAYSSFSEGDTLYVSTTEGTISNSAPTATGDFVRVVGYALSNRYIYLNPDATYIELS